MGGGAGFSLDLGDGVGALFFFAAYHCYARFVGDEGAGDLVATVLKQESVLGLLWLGQWERYGMSFEIPYPNGVARSHRDPTVKIMVLFWVR